MQRWTGEQRGFAVKAFYLNGESYVGAQQAFRRHFNLLPQVPVPDRKTIKNWIENLETTGQTTKKRGGTARTIRTPENVEAVRVAIARSPRRSARRHIIALGLSNRTMWMNDEAHFHLSGYVNKQNFHYWAPENPNELHERPLHSAKVTVWYAVLENDGRHLPDMIFKK
ncbi:PREDICTED: uncharacterized protein LOC106742984 [Dinoponera quadriceps]|uniref:Uncharacterized protein LOC106742984 n=1 Tax=Dinoponera quadriceps TaxID=609295 RepID=A0A6P3X0M1_DINQU|nr:PREDICTED: uncharacterized protein LOC106742984 [Dinoponera quadriceps]